MAGVRPAGNEFRSPGRVFSQEEFDALKASTTPLRYPQPDGSLFVGDKGMMTTGTYGDITRLIPIEKMKDYRMPAPLLTRSPSCWYSFVTHFRSPRIAVAVCTENASGTYMSS